MAHCSFRLRIALLAAMINVNSGRFLWLDGAGARRSHGYVGVLCLCLLHVTCCDMIDS